MNARRIVLTSSLAVPALLLALASCNDSNQNPVSPDTPGIGSPSTPSTPSARPFGLTDHLILLPQLSDADVAGAAVTTTTTDFAQHDPVVQGSRVRCIDGADFEPDAFPPGTSDPFRPQSNQTRGCEVNTMDGGAAAVQPTNSMRGKLVRNTRRLEFYYAGGPQNGGAPRFDLFTDYCRDAAGNPVTNMDPCSTNGTWDETLFIDQSNCNDGDPYVGAVLLKSIPNSASDPSCPVFEAYGFDGVSGTGDEHTHANWFDYIGAHPRDKFALNTGDLSGTVNDFLRLDNIIMADVPVHFLIYRVRMQAGNT